MRYCEGQFLEVAQRHGLCRPSSSVLTLEDILELHASVVYASALTIQEFKPMDQPLLLLPCTCLGALRFALRLVESLCQEGSRHC